MRREPSGPIGDSPSDCHTGRVSFWSWSTPQGENLLGPHLRSRLDFIADLRSRILFLFVAGIWLVFLVRPVQEAWAATGVRKYLGTTVILAFAICYLWHFQRSRRFAWSGHCPPASSGRGGRLARWGLLLVLAVVSTLLTGQDAAGTMSVFLGVAALWTFRMPVALPVAAVLATGYYVATLKVSGWQPDASTSVSMALSILAVMGGILSARRGAALSAARQENALLAIEEERNRVARDVHDILGHTLTVIRVKAELAAALIDVSPERAKAEVLALEELSREALSDVRRAVEGFREISLPGELARARRALAAADITASVPGSVDEVPADLRELYAWAVREATTNVVRHSAASACSISFDHSGLTISDNGRGADPDRARQGLVGLRERAHAGGAVVITRSLDPGFELTVRPTRPASPRPAPQSRGVNVVKSGSTARTAAGGTQAAGTRPAGNPAS